MILRALVDYYDRSRDLAPPGWEYKRIPYLIEITEEGRFVQLSSLRSGPKTADIAPSLVPQSEGRSGTRAFEKPNLLWDHIGFVLGHAKSTLETDVALAEKQNQHFRQRIEDWAERLPKSRVIRAIRHFYKLDEYLRVKSDSAWEEASAIAGCNVTFRLIGDVDLAVHEPGIRALIDQNSERTSDGPRAICLITGEIVPIRRLHSDISGVGRQPAPLSAINDDSLPAFSSYGKHQGENFPVGDSAVFKYTTALNHLLRPDSAQKLKIADATTVYWSQRKDLTLEDDWLSKILSDDDPNAHVRQVELVLRSVHTGNPLDSNSENRFFVLGLYPPNKARIAVRFWHEAPLHVMTARVAKWFDDLMLDHMPSLPKYPSLRGLLRSVALKRQDDNIPPSLCGDVLRSIFTGAALPESLLNLSIQRIRLEQGAKRGIADDEARYLRAAIIKACLNRSIRLAKSSEKVYAIMLDPDNEQPAYRLGRLFAILEKIQEESAGGLLNKTIRDRYYGAASSTPASIVPLLLKLKNHHVSRLDDRGQRKLYRAFQDNRPDDYIGQVMWGLSDIPSHLSLHEQGRFALGYYHQRQAFFAKPHLDRVEDH